MLVPGTASVGEGGGEGEAAAMKHLMLYKAEANLCGKGYEVTRAPPSVHATSFWSFDGAIIICFQ